MRFSRLELSVVLIAGVALLSCQSADATDREAAAAAPAAPAGGLTGKVLETMDASSYTYMRLQGADGEIWAAVPRTAVEVGATVTIANASRMDGFESETLGRSFERIVFGTLAAAPSGAQANPHAGMPAGHPAVPGASTDPGDVDVARAEGPDARTIAELFEQRADLSGKPVVLRGKVVKSMNAILGKNWLHLQDGTGDAAAGTHDITVTTADTAEVGEVVVVRGVVQLDKDFGAGYRYEVIVEEAEIQR